MILRQEGASRFGSERGFTLVELLVVMGLTAILMTLAAFEVRHFWLVRALQSTEDEVTSQLRALQEQVIAETHPNVFGAMFPHNEDEWKLLTYNPTSGCSVTRTLELPTGMRLQPGEPSDFADAGTSSSPSLITSTCRSAVGTSPNDTFVFFFGRGTATAGQVTFEQELLQGDRTATICVSGLTGRVSTDDADDCPEVS